MKGKRTRRAIAIFMIAVVLSWTTLPAIAMAAPWLTPGKAISGTKPVEAGEPYKLGEFIVPGDFGTLGTPIVETLSNISGQAIIPIIPNNSGLFWVPNSLNGMEYGDWIKATTALTAGKEIVGGTVPSGGQAPTDGTAPSGGQAPEVGQAGTGGTGPNGGQAGTGGTGPNGGQAGTGGTGPNSGEVGTGGTGPNGGQVGTDGEGPNGSQMGPGGKGPNGSEAGTGGENPTSGEAGQGGESPKSGQVDTGGENPNGGPSGKGPSGDQGGMGGEVPNDGQFGTGDDGPTISVGTSNEEPVNSAKNLKEAKKWFVTVPNYLGKLVDGTLATMAGFKITDLKTATGNKNLYLINGKAKVFKGEGKIATFLNKRYSKYLNSFENSKAAITGKVDKKTIKLDENGKKVLPKSTEYVPRDGKKVKQKKLTGLLKEISSRSKFSTEIKDYLKNNWIQIKDKKFNFSFFKADTVLKGNGITNIILSVGSRSFENSIDPTRTKTDFAAGLTTDVVLGVGQTAASAGAGWLATTMTAASFGSVVPGVGTAAGAIVGLGIAVFLSTNTGRRFSKKVEAGVKWTFEKAKDIGKGLFKKWGWGS